MPGRPCLIRSLERRARQGSRLGSPPGGQGYRHDRDSQYASSLTPAARNSWLDRQCEQRPSIGERHFSSPRLTLDSAATEVFTEAQVGKRRHEGGTMGDAREVMDRVTAAITAQDFDAAAGCYAE